MLLYIIRHGDPDYPTDTLTELGWKQAHALVPRMLQTGLDRIYASSMGRARQTAQPTAEALGLPVYIEPWAREIWPELAPPLQTGGRTFMIDMPGTDFRAADAHDRYDDWYELSCLDGIDAKQAMERVRLHSDDFLRRQGYRRTSDGVYRIERANDDHVALFCHAGLGVTLLGQLLAIPPHLFWPSFYMTHTGVTVVEFANSDSGLSTPRCLCMSDMSHLFQSGLPYRYCGRIDV